MRHMGLPEATILVGGFSSRCNACGKDVSPEATTHDVLLGYGPQNGEPGCGIKFTHIYSVYMHGGAEQRVAAMRPDLIFIDPPENPWDRPITE